MTGKDLLEGLNFVDEDLVEEAGKETLSAETAAEKKRSTESAKTKIQSKSGRDSGKIVFLRAAVSVAAGILIFAAGTAVGIHKAGKSVLDEAAGYMQTEENESDGMMVLGVYQEQEGESEGTISLSEDVKVGEKIAAVQTQQIQSGQQQLLVTMLGSTEVYFYQEEDTEGYFADFEQSNVSYTLRASTLKETVQAAADVIYGTGVITVVN